MLFARTRFFSPLCLDLFEMSSSAQEVGGLKLREGQYRLRTGPVRKASATNGLVP